MLLAATVASLYRGNRPIAGKLLSLAHHGTWQRVLAEWDTLSEEGDLLDLCGNSIELAYQNGGHSREQARHIDLVLL